MIRAFRWMGWAIISLAAATLTAAADNARPPYTEPGMISDLSSAQWFVFSAPDGKIQLTSGCLRIQATSDYGVGGRAGVIWRQPITRPASGKAYVYIWGFRNHSLIQPGRALFALTSESSALRPLGPSHYFGVAVDVTPARRPFGQVARQGELTGYHLMSEAVRTDFRLVLTPTAQWVELKSSDSAVWKRLSSPGSPWNDASESQWFLHLETCGDRLGRVSSDYWIQGVAYTTENRTQPSAPSPVTEAPVGSEPIAPPPPPPLTPATEVEPTGKPAGDDPWEQEIAAFEAADRDNPPPRDAILFIGSASFRRWETLTDDMAPLPVLNRAFGGSTTADVNQYMDRIVFPYQPRMIVYYAGDNDLTRPIDDPETPYLGFRRFAERVHATLPQTHIFYVSIKPSPARWECWPKAVEANQKVRALCEADKRLTFIDISGTLLDDLGLPIADRYVSDNLHFKAEVYAQWTEKIKPQIAEKWNQLVTETQR